MHIDFDLGSAQSVRAARLKRVAAIVQRHSIKTITLVPQGKLDDWGNTGIITAPEVVGMEEFTVRISRTFSFRVEGASDQSDVAKGGVPYSLSTVPGDLLHDRRRRQASVLWDAVSTTWPVREPSRSLLQEILLVRLRHAIVNSTGNVPASDPPSNPAVTEFQSSLDGVSIRGMTAVGDGGLHAFCCEVSGDRVVTALLPEWAVGHLRLDFQSNPV